MIIFCFDFWNLCHGHLYLQEFSEKHFIVSDPKLKKVSFEYLVNGHRIIQKDLTSTYLERAFGNTEYSVVGELKDILEIKEDTNEIIEIETFDIVIKAENNFGSYQETLRISNCENQKQSPSTVVSNAQDINVIERLVDTYIQTNLDPRKWLKDLCNLQDLRLLFI